ncbi:nucleolar and spindle-associated protein 1 isoform X1 [Aplysia californica]|uniref:Nucleolar and spindle-associated protein 1 isoform X1 n=1 Tax=Aplysia californica TaxID=6500 RepID=A0ABM0K1X1_APLCA|nr:nucleolar and spindle-associated protein 1 isoform X1 [Aplysia californica]
MPTMEPGEDIDLHFETMKYHELQKLAKAAGIKANQKIDKLVKALQEHHAKAESFSSPKAAPQSSQNSDIVTPQTSQAKTATSKKSVDRSGTQSTPGSSKSVSSKCEKQDRKPTSASDKQKSEIENDKMTSRKRRRTFELDEPTLSPCSTPSSENEGKRKETRSSTSTPKTAPMEEEPVNKRSRRNTFDKTPSQDATENRTMFIPGSSGKVMLECEKEIRKCNNSFNEGDPETTSDKQISRKRRRTFELDEPTLGPCSTPCTESEGKRKKLAPLMDTRKAAPVEQPEEKLIRRETFDKNPFLEIKEKNVTTQRSTRSSSSPSTRAIIDSMDANISSAERKAKLLSALDKKVQEKVNSSPSEAVGQQHSQIPRFMAFLTNKKKAEAQKPPTPGNKDWTKIHNKAFAKFDSIDVYLEKKQQRVQQLSNSAKKTAVSKTPQKTFSQAKVAKPVSRPAAQVKPFVPTVTSTKGINFNFNKTPTSGAGKTPSTLKSARKSFTNGGPAKTPKLLNVTSAQKPSDSAKKATPFKFTGLTGKASSLNTTQHSQKKTFDLKASLAKPLTWKPHTGKLQTVDFNKPAFVSATKSSVQKAVIRPSRQAMASKTRPTHAKDVHRAKQLDRRNNQKYIDMMKRRGLIA